MNTFRVPESPEKQKERAALEAFPRIQISAGDEASTVKRDAARHLTRVLHDYSLKFQKIEGGLEPQLKEDEIKRMEKSIKSDASKIGDSKLDQHLSRFLADAKSGKNPFKSEYIGDTEFQMRNEYGHSTLTTPDGKSGIAEVTRKTNAERSGPDKQIHSFTILYEEVTGRPRPTSHFFVLKRGIKERSFVEVMSDPTEDKQTREMLFHLDDVADGKKEPTLDLFGHNRFLGEDSSIIPQKHREQLTPDVVRRWMDTILSDNYNEKEVLSRSEEAQTAMHVEDPQLWMRVQMLRHLEKGIKELSVSSQPNEKISREKLRTKLQFTFNEIVENCEIQHAINHIEKPDMPPWLDELSMMLSSIHGHSNDYRGAQFAISIFLPVFSVAFEKIEEVRDLNSLDDGERAALLLVYGMARLEKGEEVDLKKLEKEISLDGAPNPVDAFKTLAKMDSFLLKRRAADLEGLLYDTF